MICALLSGTFAACGRTPVSKPDTALRDKVLSKLEGYSRDAHADMTKNFWSEEKGYMVDPYKDGHGRDTFSDIMWVYVQGLLCFETYIAATGDESAKRYIQTQIDVWLNSFTRSYLTATGTGNNPAHDDAAWTAMGFMLGYKFTGNETCLDYCRRMIKRSYDYWEDGSTANGLWYKYDQDGSSTVKSVYCAGLILSELEYYALTKGTEKEDAELHQRTMELYNWVEENLCRDGVKVWNGVTSDVVDYLYYCDFYEDSEAGLRYPVGYDRPNDINPAGSVSSLFGNTAMAVIHKRLYDLTGDKSYLEKAVRTANALTGTAYNVDGIIKNDRDAWTNSAFMGYFVREVLPLEGISPELGRMFINTAASIMKNAFFEGGFYGADWGGGDRWFKNEALGDPSYLTTSATTVHILHAACYAVKNGLAEPTEGDAELFNFEPSPKPLG